MLQKKECQTLTGSILLKDVISQNDPKWGIYEFEKDTKFI